MDLDDDEYLTFKEFSQGVTTRLPNMQNANQQDLQQAFEQMDNDKDFKLSLFEFKTFIFGQEMNAVDVKKLLRRIRKSLTQGGAGNDESALYRLFQQIDKDHNQMLSFRELLDCFKQFNVTLTQEEVHSVFTYFDSEKKEQIPYERFIEVL